jgi:hypothetical protein
MFTQVVRSPSSAWRHAVRGAMLGLLPFVGGPLAWAQNEAAAQSANERRQELRSVVRQPQAAPSPESAKASEQRHLNAQERSQLRRQLTRDLRAQNATLADASRP